MARKITSHELEQLDNSVIVLNQNDPLVENSGVEGVFTVHIKPLTRTQGAKLQLKHADKDGNIDTATWQKDMFLTQVVSWDGLFINEHDQNIEATEEFKEKCYEYHFAKKEVDLISSKILEINGLKAEKEEDIKKNVEAV